MGIIALLVAGIAAFLLWDTPHQTMKWVVLATAGAAWYLRRVVDSLEKRGATYPLDVHRFWSHAAVVGFWSSVIVSLVGVCMALW